jgi:hypothetical protein
VLVQRLVVLACPAAHQVADVRVAAFEFAGRGVDDPATPTLMTTRTSPGSNPQ